MKSITHYMYTPQEIKLAHELADALDDRVSLSFYLASTKKHSHRILRAALQHVLALPEESIRKSRGALFNHIINTNPDGLTDDETEGHQYFGN